MTPTPALPFDTTADDLACAVAVLAQAADRAERLASLLRTDPDHWAWAERAARAHAAVVRLAESTEPNLDPMEG